MNQLVNNIITVSKIKQHQQSGSNMRNKDLNLETVLSPAYRQIWDNSLLGIMIMDKEGVVLYINRLLIRTDDLEDADILGKKMVDFYPMEKERHVSIQTIKNGKPIIKKTILYYSHKNKLVNSLCSTFPLYSHGEVEGVIHFSLNLQISQRLIEQHECQENRQFGKRRLEEKKAYTFESLIGESPQFKNAVTYAKSNSRTDFSALIWAETGCGKELFAQSMHHASARRNNPFIPINCAAIPDNLLEATLFGTSKGAFTGAIEKAGLLENAQGGTLLLDELNSMSLELQAKLLRVIQEKKIRRVGALREIPIDVKFIATCNIPPSQALEKNKIRLDLFYRLAVVVIEIPPLRQRKSDIPLLCRYFLDQWADQTKQPSIDISDEVQEMFDLYPWPGNVRELEHTLKSSLSIIHGETTIRSRHLSSYFMDNYQQLTSGYADQRHAFQAPAVDVAGATPIGAGLLPDDLLPLQEQEKFCLNSAIQRIETRLVEKALVRAGYNISKAGRFLNLSPQSMRYKIKKLGIRVPVE
jgi:arginine utilization regulatory protein